MRKTVIATVVFLFVFASVCWATQGYRCLFHNHTTFSKDGHSTVDEVVDYAEKEGYQCIEFSDHGDSFKSMDDFIAYQNQVNARNKNGYFVTMPCVEVTVGDQPNGKNDCHINEITLARRPYLYDSKYPKEKGSEVIGILRDQGAVAVLNHYRTCPEWRGIAKNFDGIEVFNEYLGGTKDLGLYLDLMKEGWGGFVIGGIDTHVKEQVFEGIETFVFSQELTQKSIFEAVTDGGTIAAVGLRGINTNLIPAKAPYVIDAKGFSIDMEIKTELLVFASLPRCQVYRDGVPYKKIKLTRGSSMGTQKIHFSDSKPGRYALVIPGIMVTSPFYFIKKENENLKTLPGKAFRVVSAVPDGIGYTIKKEGIAPPYQATAFEYCNKDFVFSADGFAIGCKEPLAIFAGSNESSIIYYSPMILRALTQKEAVGEFVKSTAFSVLPQSYKLAELTSASNPPHLILSAENDAREGDAFFLCDPNQPLDIDGSGKIVGCSKLCEGRAAYPNIGDHWSFSPSSACPANIPTSTWLIRKK